jgi:hypothetical protein
MALLSALNSFRNPEREPDGIRYGPRRGPARLLQIRDSPRAHRAWPVAWPSPSGLWVPEIPSCC